MASLPPDMLAKMAELDFSHLEERVVAFLSERYSSSPINIYADPKIPPGKIVFRTHKEAVEVTIPRKERRTIRLIRD